MKVLVIDVGGSHVKMAVSEQPERRRFRSGKNLTPGELVAQVRKLTSDWRYDVVSLGYPGIVGADGTRTEPGNLGVGWVGYDFDAAFGRPVRLINDAAMQALGAYAGERMLFLGLGTGLGSALVSDRVLVPLELGCLAYTSSETIADRLGKEGLARHGKAAWQKVLQKVTKTLRQAFAADYVVLGGGHAKEVDPLPEDARRGGNEDAIIGGFRLWEEQVEPHDGGAAVVWRVVR